MLETFRNAWKIEDLRKRLLFTLLILVLFRLGCALPVPYISAGALTSMFAGGNGELTKAVNVKVAAYTASAKEKIEKAGGKAEVM